MRTPPLAATPDDSTQSRARAQRQRADLPPRQLAKAAPQRRPIAWTGRVFASFQLSLFAWAEGDVADEPLLRQAKNRKLTLSLKPARRAPNRNTQANSLASDGQVEALELETNTSQACADCLFLFVCLFACSLSRSLAQPAFLIRNKPRIKWAAAERPAITFRLAASIAFDGVSELRAGQPKSSALERPAQGGLLGRGRRDKGGPSNSSQWRPPPAGGRQRKGGCGCNIILAPHSRVCFHVARRGL